ncbi:signal transduction histidine kinase [Duganella sp. 1224]|uniref:sensor histidine kinase n=1 Tax=Duganella sp. 1224 TaxID=2587052 RepID=UPI0015CA7F2B|nr:HAMP domain-containing sensor histidine kinase [Duganella sp. 1224]NYE60694.1 signal transduction histidine kinase [Duganella sp. 1224]
MTLATEQNTEERSLSSTSQAMLAMRSEVFDVWEASVRANIDEAVGVSGPLLTNTLPAFYDNIAEAVTPSYPRADGASGSTAMSAHGGERARVTPFRADQVVLEYQLFRDAIADTARRRQLRLTAAEWRVIELSVDVALRDAIREFSLIHERIRERLAATLSHDMRNPLSLILGGSQLIGACQELRTAHRAAAKIEAGARRLDQMVTQLVDTLTFERVDQLPLVLSEFDIQALLHTVAQDFHRDSQPAVAIQAAPIVGHWCRNSLHRAVENLLTNAIKYGDGQQVRIKADTIRGRLMLSVHNDGAPIAADQRERIFAYLRREGEGKAGAGWGLGLPFVRSVAEGHGGSVSVDSAPGRGTTFILDIPLDCRPLVPAPQS